MALLGYQHMLFGLINDEIVVEIQIPTELVSEMEPTDAFAQRVMAHVGWSTAQQPDRWSIESQALHRR